MSSDRNMVAVVFDNKDRGAQSDSDSSGPGLVDRLKAMLGGRSMLFPSLAADPVRLTGVLLLNGGHSGPLVVNGNETAVLHRTPLGPVLDPGSFQRWENVLSVRSDFHNASLAPVVEDFEAARELKLPEGTSWRLMSMGGELLGSLNIPYSRASASSSLEEELAWGLAEMVADDGDVWSFYDLGECSFRLSGWRWDTGIVLEALATAAQRLGSDGLLRVARAVGDRLLATRLDHPQCPGGFPEWVDLRYRESAHNISQWVAPFNTAFIASGLARLTQASGEEEYELAARHGLRQAVAWGLTPAGGVAGYYFEKSRSLRYLGQINDSGILGRGLALFPEETWAGEAAQLSAGYYLDKAGSLDGHIDRAWWDPALAAQKGPPLFPEWRRHPDRVVAKIFLRGQAWALLGLAGAIKLGGGSRIREASRRLKDYVLGVQLPDGSWFYSQHQPQLGACVKTTAALALALVEWAAATGDDSPLPAVHRALDYLAGCRRPGGVPSALAGLPVDTSEEGCIIYFRGRPVICAYAGALELLARVALGDRK